MDSSNGSAASGAAREIDVILNGSRDYVQGVQLLARAAEIIAEPPGGDAMLVSAAFRAITDRRVAVRIAPPAEASGPDDAGEAVFTTPDGARRSVVFTALEGQAPRGDRPERCRYRLIDGSRAGPLTASFEADGVETLEDALVAIVQTVKALHQDLADDVSDIWFTGLRGAALPAATPLSGSAGRIAIKGGRIMGKAPNWQTLQKVEMASPDGAPIFAAMVNFAFKSDCYQAGES